MAPLLKLMAWPEDGSVFVADAVWQDEPQLRAEDAWTGTWASSLTHPEEPPFPGIRVRCARSNRESLTSAVAIECWVGMSPTDLREVLATVFSIGEHGVVFDAGSCSATVLLPSGTWPVSVRVAAMEPTENFRVAFCFASMPALL